MDHLPTLHNHFRMLRIGGDIVSRSKHIADYWMRSFWLLRMCCDLHIIYIFPMQFAAGILRIYILKIIRGISNNIHMLILFLFPMQHKITPDNQAISHFHALTVIYCSIIASLGFMRHWSSIWDAIHSFCIIYFNILQQIYKLPIIQNNNIALQYISPFEYVSNASTFSIFSAYCH